MQEAAQSAAAGTTVAFKLTVDGREYTQADPGGVEFLSVEDHCDMIGVAEFTFEGGHPVSLPAISLGADVEIEFEGGGGTLFAGHVIELRHSVRQGRNLLTVLAMDPLCKLAARRLVRAFENMTDSDIASTLFQECGVRSGTVDSTSKKHDYVLQRNESALHFLRRLAARNGFLLRAVEGKVDFAAPQFSDDPLVVAPHLLISLDYTISTQGIPRELTVYGWDYLEKKTVEATSKTGSQKPIGQGKMLGGSAGIWLEGSYISDVLVPTQDVATQLANAELDRMSRNFLRGRAVIPGCALYRAGQRVRFEGFEEGFQPDAFIVSSRHRVQPGTSYITEIAFCSNQRK